MFAPSDLLPTLLNSSRGSPRAPPSPPQQDPTLPWQKPSPVDILQQNSILSPSGPSLGPFPSCGPEVTEPVATSGPGLCHRLGDFPHGVKEKEGKGTWPRSSWLPSTFCFWCCSPFLRLLAGALSPSELWRVHPTATAGTALGWAPRADKPQIQSSWGHLSAIPSPWGPEGIPTPGTAPCVAGGDTEGTIDGTHRGLKGCCPSFVPPREGFGVRIWGWW